MVKIPFLSKRTISIDVTNISDNKSFVLTNVYAPSNTFARATFWENLMAHRKWFSQEEWIVIGYFNSTLQLQDKKRGNEETTQ